MERLFNQICRFDCSFEMPGYNQKSDKKELENSFLSACEAGDKDSIDAYIDNSLVDPNYVSRTGNFGLRATVLIGDAECICTLLQKGANVNLQSSRDTALTAACQIGDVDVCKLLISQGADVNLGRKNGELPLFIAIKNQNRQLVKFLLDNAADPMRIK
eukprot:TRINITY_DN14159_c0_g1_i3.p2 TRINITY_DN14159_c0_g1~~TRINITY_DN14159_c0_g1_i3.p2  ORF type:complete len:159 (-),score=26.86 TRINITY_DN14159_c0_g1_i3:279-755(-)